MSESINGQAWWLSWKAMSRNRSGSRAPGRLLRLLSLSEPESLSGLYGSGGSVLYMITLLLLTVCAVYVSCTGSHHMK